MTAPQIQVKSGERGAALIVGLILLTVMTILAVSTLRTSSLELVMAGNTQYREMAFRLAELGIERELAILRQTNGTTLGRTPNWTRPIAPQDINLGPAMAGSYAGQVRYVRTGNPPLSFSPDDFIGDYYRLEITGATDQRGARSTQAQGLVVVRPQSATGGN